MSQIRKQNTVVASFAIGESDVQNGKAITITFQQVNGTDGLRPQYTVDAPSGCSLPGGFDTRTFTSAQRAFKCALEAAAEFAEETIHSDCL